MPRPALFISHSHADNAVCDAVAMQLKQQGFGAVWYDQHTVGSGRFLPAEITEGLNNSQAFILMNSAATVNSFWVQLETQAYLELMHAQPDRLLMPVRLDDAEIPLLLRGQKWIDARQMTPAQIAAAIAKAVEPQGPFGRQSRSGKPKADIPTALKEYAAQIEANVARGNATEHTHRRAFSTLLESFGVIATNEPKHAAYGAPDYVVSKVANFGALTIGYVETKDIGVSLDATEKTAQLGRYFKALDNLILTDYLEFRWYVHGQERMRARLGAIERGKVRIDPAEARRAQELLELFAGHVAELIATPLELAQRMAKLTHMIRDVILEALDGHSASPTITDLRTALAEVLIPDLDNAAFADMLAQTIAYGLFAARWNHRGPQPFQLKEAAREIPKTNPFMRKLFDTINHIDVSDEPYLGFMQDLAQMLDQTDMAAVLRDFGKRTKQQDPLVHFFETFLAAYDPKLRELRGVYYTPAPVVSYIVRSVDAVLRAHFGLPGGLADTSQTTFTYQDRSGQHTGTSPRVLVLDPACGTGTFMYAVIEHIREQFQRAGNAGMWSSYTREYLLKQLFGFELMMAPYAMAHLRLGMQLAGLDLPEAQRGAWAYDFATNERLNVFLTNTLDDVAKKSEALSAHYIVEEANAAAVVKHDLPVMVVLGNPPYSGHSANNGPWIANLLRGSERIRNSETEVAKTDNYFEVDGKPLGERNPKWLNDDYVKFIRFGQWRIARQGHGVLAFVTNHGYLDNPTFRGMRQSLLRSFDDIYVLDLHGNSKKKERHPDGGKDENVFDIQQGVAIGIFVRQPGNHPRQARVHHAHLYGDRASKYAVLAEQDIAATVWTEVTPESPHYLLAPIASDNGAEYIQAPIVTEIFPVNGWGIATRKDYLLVDFNRADLITKFKDIERLSVQDAIDKYGIQESPHWDFSQAKKQMTKEVEGSVRSVLFRPFDKRAIFYEKYMIERGDHRYDLMSNMFKSNLSLITIRRIEEAGNNNHFYCSDDISVLHSTSSKEGNFVFPLYLYPDPNKGGLFDGLEQPNGAPGNRTPNLAASFIAEVTGKLGLQWVADGRGNLHTTVGPEDIFHYIYAIFHAPGYRERYAEFLKIDFPRVPLTGDVALWRELCALGGQLVGLHLLEPAPPATARYPVPGANVVEAVRYTDPQPDGTPGRVWINATQYFEGVAPEVWEFHIGGYQVCQKWLKDRKGRALAFADQQHYARIVAALGATQRVMGEIDEAIEARGGWPLA